MSDNNNGRVGRTLLDGMELGVTPVHRTLHTNEIHENKQRETLGPLRGGGKVRSVTLTLKQGGRLYPPCVGHH